MVADERSMEILVQDLGVFYSASCRGSSAQLPALAGQYADVALEQWRQLHQGALAPQLAYWKKALQGAPTLLELPTDRRRPAMQTYCGATVEFALPDDLKQGVGSLAMETGIAPATVVTAAWSVLLSRYTGQNDICLGMSVANRASKEAEALIGPLENTLVLRTQLGGNPSFRRLLAEVRETTFAALVHHDLPFERLVEELQPDRSLSHTPLFQVMVVTRKPAINDGQIPGSRWRCSLSTIRWQNTI